MPKRKGQCGDGFIEDTWNSGKKWVKDNHILSGIGSAVTPLVATWNAVAGTAAAAATAALKQNGWGRSDYYTSHKFGPGVTASYGVVKYIKKVR